MSAKKLTKLLGARHVLAGGLSLCLLGAGMLPGATALAEEPPLSANIYGNYLSGLHASYEFDFWQSARFLDAALAAGQDSDGVKQKAFDSHWRAGHGDRALEIGRTVEPGVLSAPLMSFVLGLDAMRTGDVERAEAYFEGVLRGPLNYSMLPFARAWILAEDGRTGEAVEVLRRAKRVPKLLMDIMEGRIHEYAGDLDAAEKAYLGGVTDSLALRIPTLRALVRLEVRRGNLEAARNLLASYMELAPGVAELEDDMSRLMRDKTLPSQAASPQQAIAEGLYYMAREYAQASLVFSLDVMRTAVFLDPDLVLGHGYIASLLEERSRFKEANEIYATVPENHAFYWQAQRRMARNLSNMGEKEEAIARLEEIAVQRPGHLDALDQIGRIYQGMEHFQEMVDTYGRLIERLSGDRREHWIYYYLRGIGHNQVKDWDAAEADFLKALDLNPEQPDVLNYLGYSWVDMKMNLDQALDMLKRAVEKSRSGYIIDSLGWAYFRLGRFEEAVIELEKAVFLEPLEPVINDHLGDAYWKVGRKREARYQWERVLGLEVTEEVDQDEVARKLETGLPEDS